MVLYGFPHKLLVKLLSFFLKAKSLNIFNQYSNPLSPEFSFFYK